MKPLARSSLLVAAFFWLDKLTGLLRQLLVARQFGVGPQLDAFNVAHNLPDLLFALISGGALSLAFIPVLAQTLEREGREALWQLFSRVANLAFLATGLLSLGLAVFALPLVRWKYGIAPGFDRQQQQLVAELMRLDLISTLIFSLSGLVLSALQSLQHFLLPAMAPVFYNLGMIVGVLILAPARSLQIGSWALPALGLGIRGLVYGGVLGAGLHLAIQLPGLWRYRFRYAFSLGLRDPLVAQVARLMGPRILSLGAVQLISTVTGNLASYLGAGAVSALAYGWLIMQLPETMIGTAVGTVLLPSLAEQWVRGDEAGFNRALGRGVGLILLLTSAAGVSLAFLLPPLVSPLFGFDPRGTHLVVLAAQMYLIGLLGQSLLEVAARAFYARQDARTPLLASLVNLGAFLGVAPWLARASGPGGIALANSLTFSFEALLLLALLWRSGRRFDFLLSLGKAGLMAAALAGVMLVWQRTGLPLLPFTLGGSALCVAISLPLLWPELRGWARG
jgi:putative peptidoglycan lipid II flippase